MAFTVEQLIEGHQEPVTVCPYFPAQQALELMIEHDFSQLPVVDDNKKPLGIVSGDSILRALNNFGVQLSDLQVLHAIVKVDLYRPDEDLFDLLDDLKNTYAVLIVDGDGTLKSIVTSYDTTEYFRRRAEDMMYVEDIEGTIKDFIRIAFNSADDVDQSALTTAIAEMAGSDLRKKFQNALNNYLNSLDKGKVTIDQGMLDEVFTRHFISKDAVRSFDDLTLNEYIQLLLHKSKWASFNSVFQLKPEAVHNLLNAVRETRNALAHFHGEISTKQRDQLHFCAEWLERHRSDVLAAFQVNTSTTEIHQGAVALEITATITEPTSDEISPIEEEVSPNDSRYAPLALLLQEQPTERDKIQFTFKQIEEIIGDELPASARQHRSWWANDSVGHVQSQQWLEVGWRVSFVDMENETVLFIRNKEKSKPYNHFFNLFHNELSKVAPFPIKSYSATDRNWITISQVPKTASFGLCFARHSRFRVELYIDTGDKGKNKQIFDALYKHRFAIQNELEGVPGSLEWERIDDKRASRIALYQKGAITDHPNKLASLREWAVDAMVKFQKIMDEHLSEVL